MAVNTDPDEFNPLHTREGWAAWVNADTEPPPLIKDLDALSTAERDAYNRRRFVYMNESITINTDLLQRVIHSIKNRLHRNEGKSGLRPGVMINGAPGTGKSTTLKMLGRGHELNARKNAVGRAAAPTIPVMHVSLPYSAYPLKMAMAFARFLALPIAYAPRPSEDDVTDAVCQTARAVKCELILVDELHNISLETQKGADVSDQLKYFGERIPATFVYAGVDLLGGRVFSGPRGDQFLSRFGMIESEQYYYGSPAQRRLWQKAIAGFESRLPLHRQQPGSLVRRHQYMFDRTGGMIGSLSELIRGGAINAILDGSECITKAHLDDVDLDVIAEGYTVTGKLSASTNRSGLRRTGTARTGTPRRGTAGKGTAGRGTGRVNGRPTTSDQNNPGRTLSTRHAPPDQAGPDQAGPDGHPPAGHQRIDGDT